MESPKPDCGARRRRRWIEPVERIEDLLQFMGSHRFAEIVVHAGGKAQLAVALHGIGGHGDDADRVASFLVEASGFAVWPRSRPFPASWGSMKITAYAIARTACNASNPLATVSAR